MVKISIRDLRSKYQDKQANYVLSEKGYIKLLPKKPRGFRYYEVLKPLPPENDYQDLKLGFYYTSVSDLLQKFLYDYELLLEKTRNYAKAFPDTHQHKHEITNEEVLVVLEKHFNSINDAVFNFLDKKNYWYLCSRVTVLYIPSFDYSVSEIGRGPTRNDLLNELCEIAVKLSRCSDGIFYENKDYEELISHFESFVQDVYSKNLKYTAYNRL